MDLLTSSELVEKIKAGKTTVLVAVGGTEIRGPHAVLGGHTILARNFDFEAGSVFDDGKVVFLVRQEGKIPFASVAWPGLIGVLSGMNAKGLSVVVHGGRARDTRAATPPA